MKTTSYGISKKLKEAGFEAEADFYWVKTEKNNIQLDFVESEVGCFQTGWEYVEAYDLETILDALPKQFQVAWDGELGKSQAILRLTVEKDKIFYNHDSDELRNAMYWREKEVQKTENESLADTAGRLWLMLKGLV